MAKANKSKWKKVAAVILCMQAIFTIVTMGIVFKVNLLPDVYMVLMGAVLLFLLTLSYFFMYLGGKKNKKANVKKKKRKIYIKRSIGCAIAVFSMIVCSIGSYAFAKADDTMRNIADQEVMTDTVSVYVLADNPAESVFDVKDGLFAISGAYDKAHTDKAIEQINQNVQKTIKTQNYETVLDMVDALYEENVDAMILNEAYVDVIESQDGYEDFGKKTKTLFDHEVQTTITDHSETDEKDITKDAFVVYISGSDTRNLKLATSRSDVNILAVVNPSTKQVLLVNTPRDYYLDTTASTNGMKDKLTHCGMYGIDCSMSTLANLYSESVDYYVQINFNGFQTLIDAVGGITIEAEKSFRTREGGFYINQGTNQLNGTVALAYARERKAFADGDNARGRHQMQMIEAIIKKVSSGTTILSNYSGIMSSMEGMFATNMSATEIASLVKMQLSDGASWNVKSFAVSGAGSSQKTFSMPTKRSYVMIPDESQVTYAELLINKVVDGVTLTDEDLVMPTVTN